MKKVILLVLSLVLALACAMSSFAYWGIVSWDEPEAAGKFDGKSLNDGSIGSEVNRIRMNWTASRAMPQENAMFVNLGTDDAPNMAVKITGTEYITNDPDSADRLKGTAYVAADLKVVNPGTFCGIVIDCNQEAGFNSSGNTVFNATHDNYILYSGYGFTLKDKNTIVAFVNASEAGSVDAVEIALGFDASEAFHTYALYRDEGAKTSYLRVDNKLLAIFDFSKDADNIGIYTADGKTFVNTNNNWNNGNVWFAVVGESEVYLDNIGYDSYVTWTTCLDSTSFRGKGGESDPAEVAFAGWAGFTQDIKAFGYKLDDAEPVFDEGFTKSTEPAVVAIENGGPHAKRFTVTIPTADMTGEHTAVVVVKLADDSVIALDGENNTVDTVRKITCGAEPLKVPENAYLKEAAAEEGKIDLLAGKTGKYLCAEDMSSNGEDITILTDGVISASKDTPVRKLDRIHLNDQWTNDASAKTVEFAGVDAKFCYAVEFSGLDKITMEAFDIYFARQKDDGDLLVGRDMASNLTEKNFSILYSVDGGKTYAVAYDSTTDADKKASYFGDDTNTFIKNLKDVEADGAKYDYREGSRTFAAPIENVTNVVFASQEGKGNAWPACTTELNIWGSEAAPADEPYEGFVNASFDYIDTYADADAKTKIQTNVGYEKSAGFGSDALDAIQRTIKSEDGSIKAIKVQGWAGFDQEIEEYGYRINGVDTIVAGSKFDSAADKAAVQDATKGGGQYAHRYGMTIPVGDLKGENKIVVIAKLADGTIVELNGDFNDKLHEYSQTANTSFTFVGPKAEDPKPNKPTSDVAVAFAVVAVAAMAVVVLKKRETI